MARVSMKQDHVGFTIFLAFLLLVPRMPLDTLGLPAATTLPLGFVGLLIWGAISPYHLGKIRRPILLAAPLGLVVFGVYSVGISFISGSIVSAGYSLQYLGYLSVSYLMFTGYLQKAIKLNRIHIVFRIIFAIVAIFTMGLLISVWTGPLYLHQVTAWQISPIASDLGVFRAVGFGQGVNTSAALMLGFLGLAGFYSGRGRYIFLMLIIGGVLMTLSRSAIFALLVSAGLLFALQFARGRATKSTVRAMIVGIYLSLLVPTALILGLSAFPDLGKDPAVSAVVERFAASGDRGVLDAATARIRAWTQGMNAWADGNINETLFGTGFRGSQSVSITASAWATPHNTYVAILGDFGILGFLLFVWPILWTIVSLTGNAVSRKAAGITVLALCGIIALAIHNMSGLFYYSPITITQTLLSLVIITMLVLPKSKVLGEVITKYSETPKLSPTRNI